MKINYLTIKKRRLLYTSFFTILAFVIGSTLIVPGISGLLASFQEMANAYQTIDHVKIGPWSVVGLLSVLLLYTTIILSLQWPSHIRSFTVAAAISPFTIWCVLFIYRSSFVAIDQQRYFSLFDDAMISMRYGWNLAHGAGLVWNPGEHVEGYTNLLMTLIMALTSMIVDKKLAVFVIQVFGIFCLLTNGWLLVQITQQFTLKYLRQQRFKISVLALGLLFTYYPLSYWTLMGMETGLLTALLLLSILLVLRYEATRHTNYLWLISITLGLSYLTRPDSIIPAMLIIMYVVYVHYLSTIKQKKWWKLFITLGIYSLFIVGMGLFRWLYYGELVPNTYVLKMTGMSTVTRMSNGWGFILPYLKTHGWLYGLAFWSILKQGLSRQRVFSFTFAVIFLVYTIWVGGDPWPYWRFTTPGLPLLFFLIAEASVYFSDKISGYFQTAYPQIDVLSKIPQGAFLGMFIIFVSLAINTTFLSEMWFQKVPYQVDGNRLNVNRSLAINYLTTSDATVGVFGAGVIPYFTDRQAIDFFGKSDPRIAHLSPDLSGAVSWAGMFSVPGHNKYDLNYSIVLLQPTYIESSRSGQQDLTEWASNYYTEVTYRGTTLLLRTGASTVYWDRIGFA